MPSYTLNQMIDAVRSQTNELDHEFIKQADIKRWLNDAQDNITDFLKIEEKTTVLLVEAQEDYDIPADINKFIRVDVDGKKYSFKGLDTFNDDPAGNIYTAWENKIYLYPVPDAAAAGDALNIYYYRKPARLDESSDKTDIDEKYDELLILYAIARCYQKAQEDMKFKSVMEEYEGRKAAMFVAQDKHERTSYLRQEFKW